MFGYYLGLGLVHLRRNPALTVLMVVTLAVVAEPVVLGVPPFVTVRPAAVIAPSTQLTMQSISP